MGGNSPEKLAAETLTGEFAGTTDGATPAPSVPLLGPSAATLAADPTVGGERERLPPPPIPHTVPLVRTLTRRAHDLNCWVRDVHKEGIEPHTGPWFITKREEFRCVLLVRTKTDVSSYFARK